MDVWYEQRSWSPEVRAAFLQRLVKARGQRRQYLKRQVQVLLEAGHLEAALEVADLGLADNPQDNQNQVLHVLRATALDQLDRIPEAVAALRAALSFRVREPRLSANPSLALAWLVVRRRLTDLYDEALASMSRVAPSVTVPFDVYRFHGAMAVIEAARHRAPEAAEHARQALAAAGAVHSGWPRHPRHGLVAEPDPVVHDALMSLAGPGSEHT